MAPESARRRSAPVERELADSARVIGPGERNMRLVKTMHDDNTTAIEPDQERAIEFEPVDVGRPFSLDDELARIPESATVKGVIMNAVTDQLARGGHASASPLRVFSDYKMHDYMRKCVEVAQILWPHEPVREGLRRLGHGHYSAFVDTTLGKMVFGVLGRNMERVIRNSPKGYKYTTNCSLCRVVDVSDNIAIVELGGLPFPDAIQVGVFEGGVRATGFVPTVRTRVTNSNVVQLEVSWATSDENAVEPAPPPASGEG